MGVPEGLCPALQALWTNCVACLCMQVLLATTYYLSSLVLKKSQIQPPGDHKPAHLFHQINEIYLCKKFCQNNAVALETV